MLTEPDSQPPTDTLRCCSLQIYVL